MSSDLAVLTTGSESLSSYCLTAAALPSHTLSKDSASLLCSIEKKKKVTMHEVAVVPFLFPSRPLEDLCVPLL